MANARESFLGNIEGIRNTLTDPALSTQALTSANAQHNMSSRVLRRGLFVVTFNLLEDFLKSRTSELLNLASATTLRFQELPPGLRSAAISAAYQSGMTQARFQRDDSDTILQDVAAAVASTAGGVALQLHKYSFLHASSNVGVQDINDVLAALHVKDPWGQLDELVTACGISTLPLKSVYSGLHQKRNAAAHDPTANIEIADLTELSNTSLMLAAAFDLACSWRFLAVRENRAFIEGSAKSPVVGEIEIRLVTEHPRGWAELRADGRPRKVHATRQDAVSSSLLRVRRPQTVVVKAADNLPVDWFPFGY